MKEPTTETRADITPPTRLLLVGVGGMGVNSVDALHAEAQTYADCIAIDADADVLNASPAPRQVQIGSTLTRGHSTGGDPDLGRRAANGDFAKLRELFANADIVVLITGLGGGVGSGASPVIAQTARDEGALVIGIAALPFPFEGVERIQIAEESLVKLKEVSHSVIILPNQYLLEESRESLSVEASFSKAAERIGAGFKVIWKLLGQRNLINLDFISLKHMLETAGGACTFVYAEGGGDSKATLTLNRLLAHPAIAENHCLKEANGLLVGILGSEDMTLAEVQEVMHGITGKIHSNAHRHMGVGIDPHLRNRMAVVLFVGGKEEEPEEEAEPGRIPKRVVPPSEQSSSPATKKTSAGKRAKQEELPLPSHHSKGRFNNVEPTIYQGEDLDLPTFIRRGLRLTR